MCMCMFVFLAGCSGVLWYLLWIYFIYEEPCDHPNITKSEIELIGKHWNSKEKVFCWIYYGVELI